VAAAFLERDQLWRVQDVDGISQSRRFGLLRTWNEADGGIRRAASLGDGWNRRLPMAPRKAGLLECGCSGTHYLASGGSFQLPLRGGPSASRPLIPYRSAAEVLGRLSGSAWIRPRVPWAATVFIGGLLQTNSPGLEKLWRLCGVPCRLLPTLDALTCCTPALQIHFGPCNGLARSNRATSNKPDHHHLRLHPVRQLGAMPLVIPCARNTVSSIAVYRMPNVVKPMERWLASCNSI
jgi:hypothetical protein